MDTINLSQEKTRLEEKISKIESRITPLQVELKEYRERLSHVNALMGPAENPEPSTLSFVGEPPKGFWVKKCKELGILVRGDSAHRVLMRHDRQLHDSIPHNCTYDGRRYP